ncbi:MAG: recombinase family protein [Pseudonocardiaceae bacterium]
MTAQGLRWTSGSVCGVISSRHVTGIRVFRGEDFGDGDWPVIIDRGTWTEAQDRRAYRAAARQRPFRFYVLRGLVMCKKCGCPVGRLARWPGRKDRRTSDLRSWASS